MMHLKSLALAVLLWLCLPAVAVGLEFSVTALPSNVIWKYVLADGRLVGTGVFPKLSGKIVVRSALDGSLAVIEPPTGKDWTLLDVSSNGHFIARAVDKSDPGTMPKIENMADFVRFMAQYAESHSKAGVVPLKHESPEIFAGDLAQPPLHICGSGSGAELLARVEN